MWTEYLVDIGFGPSYKQRNENASSSAHFFGLYGWFSRSLYSNWQCDWRFSNLHIFVTAFIGVALMKREGALIIRHWQINLLKAKQTHQRSQAEFLILGAVLMLLPGYITDFIGLICFTPGLRVLIGRAFISRLGTSVFSSVLASGFPTRFSTARGPSSYDQTVSKPEKPTSHHQPLEGDVIEGQFKLKTVRKNKPQLRKA